MYYLHISQLFQQYSHNVQLSHRRDILYPSAAEILNLIGQKVCIILYKCVTWTVIAAVCKQWFHINVFVLIHYCLCSYTGPSVADIPHNLRLKMNRFLLAKKASTLLMWWGSFFRRHQFDIYGWSLGCQQFVIAMVLCKFLLWCEWSYTLFFLIRHYHTCFLFSQRTRIDQSRQVSCLIGNWNPCSAIYLSKWEKSCWAVVVMYNI